MAFHEAQERFQNGKLFSSHGYLRDLLQNYGNAGLKMDLPKVSGDDYEKALRFRHSEKQHYSNLEQQLATVTERLHTSESLCDQFAAFINEQDERRVAREKADILNVKESDAPPSIGDSVDRLSGDGGGGVLSAAGGSSQDDTVRGQSEAIISSSSVTDEPANALRNRTRRNNAKPEQKDTGAGGAVRSEEPVDSGRTPPEPADGAESAVGGQASEHDTQE